MACPYCQGDATQERERRTALGYRLFRCRPCRRTVNERTGTPFNHLQMPPDHGPAGRGRAVARHQREPLLHPMHLHGHTLVMRARNGQPLRGSPVSLDTLSVLPSESYDVAFRADNPGIWMLHCHNLYHARHGMGLMVMYRGVVTPFKDGGPVGNISD